jgi:hypothetical protein
MADTPGNPFEKALKLSEHIRRLQLRGSAFGHEVDVPDAANAISVQPKMLSGKPLDPVTLNGFSHAFGDGNTEAVAGAGSRGKVGQEIGGVNPPTLPGKTNKFRSLS